MEVKKLISDCDGITYLEDSSCNLFGYRIWGAPWQPKLGTWAFNLERGEQCLEAWKRIPDDTDILITHGPPKVNK